MKLPTLWIVQSHVSLHVLWKTLPWGHRQTGSRVMTQQLLPMPSGFWECEQCVHVENHWAVLPNTGHVIHSTLQMVCSGNWDRQLVRTWHHASSSEPQAAKAQGLERRKGLSSTTRKDAASKTTAVYTVAMLVAWNEYCWIVGKMSRRLRSSI